MVLANIPMPGTLMVDPKTGVMSLPWYQFFQAIALQQGLIYGSGLPASAQGSNGNFYFRSDGTVGSNVYQKASGAWSAIL